MDIKKDQIILSVQRKCETCSNNYEIMEDSEMNTLAICGDCSGTSATSPTNFDTSTVKSKNFKTLPSSGYSSLLPYQVPQVRKFLESVFPFDGPIPTKIIDATAHIGGDCIHFSKLWPLCKITAIDIDETAIKALKTNISNFSTNSNNFEIVCADSTEWIKNNRKTADFYYFDPPWGGPNYCSEDELSLFLGGETKTPIVDLVNFILDENLSPKVLLKAPRNFAYSSFKKDVHGTTKIHYIRKPAKRESVAYSLILINK